MVLRLVSAFCAFLMLLGGCCAQPDVALPVQSMAPSVDSAIGYRLEDLGDGIYIIVGARDYTAVFAITDEGVVSFDAPSTMAAVLRQAIASKTDASVTHLIYCHHIFSQDSQTLVNDMGVEICIAHYLSHALKYNPMVGLLNTLNPGSCNPGSCPIIAP